MKNGYLQPALHVIKTWIPSNQLLYYVFSSILNIFPAKSSPVSGIQIKRNRSVYGRTGKDKKHPGNEGH